MLLEENKGDRGMFEGDARPMTTTGTIPLSDSKEDDEEDEEESDEACKRRRQPS